MQRFLRHVNLIASLEVLSDKILLASLEIPDFRCVLECKFHLQATFLKLGTISVVTN